MKHGSINKDQYGGLKLCVKTLKMLQTETKIIIFNCIKSALLEAPFTVILLINKKDSNSY